HVLYSYVDYVLIVCTLDQLFIPASRAHSHLHPFPTRRSSDLLAPAHVVHPVVDAQLALGHRLIETVGRFRDHGLLGGRERSRQPDRKSTRLNSSHQIISYAVFCLKKKNTRYHNEPNKI